MLYICINIFFDMVILIIEFVLKNYEIIIKEMSRVIIIWFTLIVVLCGYFVGNIDN